MVQCTAIHSIKGKHWGSYSGVNQMWILKNSKRYVRMSLRYRIPQVPIGLPYTLTYTSQLTVRGGYELNFAKKETI